MAEIKKYPRVAGENPGDDVKLSVSSEFPALSATLLPKSELDPVGYKLGGNINLPVLWALGPDGKDIKGDFFLKGGLSGTFKKGETPGTFGFSLDVGYKQTLARNNKTKDAFKLVFKGGVKSGDKPTWTTKGGLVVERDMRDGKGEDLRTPILGIDLGLVGLSSFEIGARTNVPVESVYLQANATLGLTRPDGKFFFTKEGFDAKTFAGDLTAGAAVMFNPFNIRSQDVKQGTPAFRLDGTFGRNWDEAEDIGSGDEADKTSATVGLGFYFAGKGGETMRDIVTGYGEGDGFSEPTSAFFIRGQFNYGSSLFLEDRFYLPAQCDETAWESCQYFDAAQAAAFPQIEGDVEYTPTRRAMSPKTSSIDVSIGGSFLDLFTPGMKIPKTNIGFKIVPEIGVSIPIAIGEGAVATPPVLKGGLTLKGSFEDTVGGLTKRKKGSGELEKILEQEQALEERRKVLTARRAKAEEVDDLKAKQEALDKQKKEIEAEEKAQDEAEAKLKKE